MSTIKKTPIGFAEFKCPPRLCNIISHKKQFVMSTKISERFVSVEDAKSNPAIAQLIERKNVTGLLQPSITRLVKSGVKEATLLDTTPLAEHGVNALGQPWVRIGCPIEIEVNGVSFQFLRNIEGTQLKKNAKLRLELGSFTPEGQEKPVDFVRAIEKSYYDAIQKQEKQAAEA